MATVKVKWSPSTVEGKAGTIFYQITHRRVVKQITTDYKIYPNEWDKSQSKLIVNSSNKRLSILQSIAQRLRNDIKRLRNIIEMLGSRPSDYTSDDIVTAFH